eukprot:8623708-Pyramimonas_sp.AAC.1
MAKHAARFLEGKVHELRTTPWANVDRGERIYAWYSTKHPEHQYTIWRADVTGVWEDCQKINTQQEFQDQMLYTLSAMARPILLDSPPRPLQPRRQIKKAPSGARRNNSEATVPSSARRPAGQLRLPQMHTGRAAAGRVQGQAHEA